MSKVIPDGAFPCALFLEAVKSNNVTEVITMLLNRDTTIVLNKLNCFHKSVSEAYSHKHMEILKLLLYTELEYYDISKIIYPMTAHTHIDGTTPLMIAAGNSNPEMVQLLLDEYPNDHKIMLTAKNYEGDTANMISWRNMNYEGDVEIYDLLRSCGVDDKGLDKLNRTGGTYPVVW